MSARVFTVRSPTDWHRMPWKNGGGTTFEIAQGGQDSIDWRLSLALIEKSGPFSRFEGLERDLMLLSGGPLQLHIGQSESATLDAPLSTWRFSGDDEVHCTLLGTTVRVLNVMRARLPAGPRPVAIMALARTLVSAGGQTQLLLPQDTALIEPGARPRIVEGAAVRIDLSGDHPPQPVKGHGKRHDELYRQDAAESL